MSKTAPRSAINVDKSRSSLQKELRDKLAWSVGTVLSRDALGGSARDKNRGLPFEPTRPELEWDAREINGILG